MRSRPMKLSTIMVACLAVGFACWISGAFAEDSGGVLDAAKEKGRSQSRYLKETKPAPTAGDAVPKADITRYKKSVEPILTRSCVACHGPKNAKGGFRIDRLNPDLLAGPDADRSRALREAARNRAVDRWSPSVVIPQYLKAYSDAQSNQQ